MAGRDAGEAGADVLRQRRPRWQVAVPFVRGDGRGDAGSLNAVPKKVSREGDHTMLSCRWTVWLFLVFGYLSAPVSGGIAAPPDSPTPGRVKPVEVRKVGVQPWETVSESPFGGSRMGGSDQRGFVLSPNGKLLVGEDAGGWQLE